MTQPLHPAVEWVLDRLGPVVDDVATNYDHRNGGNCILKRVDRDNSAVYDGGEPVDMTQPMRKRSDKLTSGNYVGAAFVDRAGEPVGPGYDLDVDVVVGVLVEGMHTSEYGHVDPTGQQGIPFRNGEDGLVDRVQSAIYAGREYPDAAGSNASFTHLTITNEDLQSANWADFYRYSFDVGFNGFETLS